MLFQNEMMEPRYNLSYVIKETGIKADTVRAWEKRYHLPQPTRTESGHRLFSDYDIETIKWLMSKQKEGLRISKAVNLFKELETEGKHPIQSVLPGLGLSSATYTTTQNREILPSLNASWVEACLNFDEANAKLVLNQAFAQFSVATVCTDIIQRGLAEVGKLWYQGKATVQQEHFTSELANRSLQSLIQAAPLPIRKETILVGCPSGETHIFPSHLITLLLRHRSWNVIYLGADVPIDEFQITVEKTKPDLVVMTAMRTVTAAALRESAIFLQDQNIPLAYGGGVFDRNPSISNRIPGFFLGKDIQGSIDKIEGLLSGKIFIPKIEKIPLEYNQIAEIYAKSNPLIDVQLSQYLEDNGIWEQFLQDNWFVNDSLSQEIIAALKLGDLHLIDADLDWIRNLMKHRGIPDYLLDEYLSAYYKTVQTILKEDAQPLLGWLETRLNK
jgi:methanogenic corrinoid protein MtbC1